MQAELQATFSPREGLLEQNKEFYRKIQESQSIRNTVFLINTELKNLIIFADPVDNLHESIEDYSST